MTAIADFEQRWRKKRKNAALRDTIIDYRGTLFIFCFRCCN